MQLLPGFALLALLAMTRVSAADQARLVAERSVKRIRDDLGTEPKVYYIGL